MDLEKKVAEMDATGADPVIVEGAKSVAQETEGANTPLSTDPCDEAEKVDKGFVPRSQVELED